MVRFVIGLVVACLMGAAASAGEYRNGQFEYRIQFPDGWTIEEDSKNDAVAASNQKGDVFIAVQAGKLDAPNISPDQVEIGFSSGVFDGWEKMGSAHGKMAGLEGTKALYRTAKDGQRYVAGAFYIVRYQTAYILYAIVSDQTNQSQKLLKQADDVFKTFRCCGQ